MTQILHFDQLKLTDDLANNHHEIQTRQDFTDFTENASQTEDTDLNDLESDEIDFELAIVNEPLNNSNNNNHDGVALGTDSDQSPGEKSSSDDITTSDKEDLVPGDPKFPTFYPSVRRKNEWSLTNINGRNCYIRYQTCTIEDGVGIKCSTSAERLFDENPLISNKEGEELLFHDTCWDSAESIVRKGPKLSRKSRDLAGPDGAFYLSHDYEDCYRWGQLRKDDFKGENAMLIYETNLNDLSEDGKELSKKEWKDHVYENNRTGTYYDWVTGPMNANPSKSYEPGQKIPICRTLSGGIPMQSVIRSQTMCRKLRNHLVGCIFYEKVDSSYQELNQNKSVRKEKRHRSKTQSKTRGSKRSHRQ